MSLAIDGSGRDDAGDRLPGQDERHVADLAAGVRSYVIGLCLALVLTGLSFLIAAGPSLIWTQGIPVALIVLAIAQVGVHLVFFLHLTSGPDNTNNALALAFGTLVVFLVLAGTLWIMSHLNHSMMSPHRVMDMQR